MGEERNLDQFQRLCTKWNSIRVNTSPPVGPVLVQELVTYVALLKEDTLGKLHSLVMYGCESWTIKKAECGRTDAFELWC